MLRNPRSIRVLVACEYSGRVRDAFRVRGFDAWSCDLLPCEGDPTYHIQGDVLGILDRAWDLMICHPPCTHLCVSGARHFASKLMDGRQSEALDFIIDLMHAPIKHIALENPIGIISSIVGPPDQIIHPYQFGHPEKKSTCLWLDRLPLLYPTEIVQERKGVVHAMTPSPTRWKDRSRTYLGIACAMANQWGDYLITG